MHILVPTAVMIAQATFVASVAAAFTLPAILVGTARAIVAPRCAARRRSACDDAPYSTTILGEAAARRASTASHLAQTRAAMAR